MTKHEGPPQKIIQREGFNLNETILELEKQLNEKFSDQFKNLLTRTDLSFAEAIISLPKESLKIIDEFICKKKNLMDADAELIDAGIYEGLFQDKMVVFSREFSQNFGHENIASKEAEGKNFSPYLLYHLLCGSTVSSRDIESINSEINHGDFDNNNNDPENPNNLVINFLNEAWEELQQEKRKTEN